MGSFLHIFMSHTKQKLYIMWPEKVQMALLNRAVLCKLGG